MAEVSALPYPPLQLANRVGCLEHADDPFVLYDQLGLATRRSLQDALPAEWDWTDKRVLDFGCGAGRTLRQWLPEAELAQFMGCDIDLESVQWLQEHLSPPFTVFENAPLPPLAQADAAFDLIYAVSVFTHLTDTWSAWLLELHRLLDADGLLLLTFIGPGIGEWTSGEPWDEERTGMFSFREGQSWDAGGPMVMHSEWWIREHWGRAFEVLSVAPAGFASENDLGVSQGIVALRKRDVELTIDDLERIDPSHPKEAGALARNLAFVQREVVDLRTLAAYERGLRGGVEQELARAKQQAIDLEGELARVSQAHERVVTSRSWRASGPLRRAAAEVRARRRKS